MTRRQSEYVLTKAVAQALSLHLDRRGIPWTHFPAGESRTARTGAKLKRMGLQAGWPDFQIIGRGGHALFIELKVGSGTLSKAQRRVHHELTQTGALVSVCSSVEAVLMVLESEGLMDMPLLPAVRWTGRAAA